MSLTADQHHGETGDRLDPKSFGEIKDESALMSMRGRIDDSCRLPCLVFFATATAWLVLGSLLALIASIKLHTPRFMDSAAWLTFGRVRPAHLDTVIFGWASLAGIGVCLWLMCRLCRTTLRYPIMLVVAAVLWNVGVTVGTVAVLMGKSTGVEWLEFPPYATFFLFLAFGIVAIWAMFTFGQRAPGHVYVSQWYLFGALFWFPWLYATVQILIISGLVTGVAQASINWWFAHNVLGLWFTPIGLAAIYYLIPKVIGRPIHSYYLSILGFWSLALFYSWAGAHHFISGPAPAWLVTASIVGSVMMLIPVSTVAINHHMTVRKHFAVLRYSPTLRFIVFGAMSYTLVSVQGSSMSVHIFNEPTHFTHHTVAHAHLGLYAFFSMTMFGSMYYIVPRLTGREWSSSKLIRIHFWFAAIGIMMYWGLLTIGGFIQGFEMNQASSPLGTLIDQHGFFSGLWEFFAGFKAKNGAVPWLAIVKDTLPWLLSRSISGTLMTIAHLAFGALLLLNLTGWGRQRQGPTLFVADAEGYHEAFRPAEDWTVPAEHEGDVA